MTVSNASIRTAGPGELSYVSYLHCLLYKREYGFDATFEYYLLEGMARFMENPEGGRVWIVESGGLPAGSIAIARATPDTAQLRWFLLQPELRGKGLGKALMDTALNFCQDRDFKTVFLWTVKELDAARHLYETYGFRLTEEKSHYLWGRNIVEERWDLQLR